MFYFEHNFDTLPWSPKEKKFELGVELEFVLAQQNFGV